MSAKTYEQFVEECEAEWVDLGNKEPARQAKNFALHCITKAMINVKWDYFGWRSAKDSFMAEVVAQYNRGEITEADMSEYAKGSGAMCGFLAGMGWGVMQP